MPSIVIKIITGDGNGTVRRRKFDTSTVTLATVQEIANLQTNAELTWTDEENDVIAVTTQDDLNEAILNAISRNSTLRLHASTPSVPNVSTASTPLSESAPAQPTPVQPTPVRPPCDIREKAKSLIDCGSQRFLSVLESARSALTSSSALKAIKEDARSIRSVFEARVERNRSTMPIQLIIGFVVRAYLLWALLFPSFGAIFKIGLGMLLMPRNALSNKARAQVCVFLPLLALRVVSSVIFGLTCCILPILIPLLLCLCFLGNKKRCVRRRCAPPRCHRHHEGHNSHGRNAGQSPEEQESLETLRKIFPTIKIEHLRKTYRRHKDVQRTVLAYLK